LIICCVHAIFALKEEGYETIMINCNPETVSTDYDISDKLYFEPLTFENVMNIIEKEKPSGVIVQFGGQTPLKLSNALYNSGVNIIGTSPKNIDIAEDRELFKNFINTLGFCSPKVALLEIQWKQSLLQMKLVILLLLGLLMCLEAGQWKSFMISLH